MTFDRQIMHLSIARGLIDCLESAKTCQSWEFFQGVFRRVYRLTKERQFELIIFCLRETYLTGPYSKEFDEFVKRAFLYLLVTRPDVWGSCQEVISEVRQVS